ncbi:MAG: HAMP domain-containing histidine kinase [Ferrovibrio sp.]|uniref:HAMP domain-containing sensor histidine kinase n=1 Tax=Ferrovibrio sp. TaxID=1917215 RepID=UPI002601B843|nr:HAMP domain-containing sensor histidine kinase [Ferrovibrio sp.]MCW0235081.1 HAMP domain-containing histidine kinase [Ferrovibrio sp.]
MKFIGRSLRRFGSDRIVWRIAGTIILAILCTQVATVLLLQATRPRDIPHYSVDALTAEMRRHVSGQPAADSDILMRLVDPGEPPSAPANQSFLLREFQRRIQLALTDGLVDHMMVELDLPRPGYMLLWSMMGPRIGPPPGPPPGVPPGTPLGPPPGPPPDFSLGDRPPPPLFSAGAGDDFSVPGMFAIWIQQNGRWQAYRAKISFEPLSPLVVTLLWFVLLTSIIAGLAFWSTWRMLRPFKQLVTAAQGWRAEQEPVSLPEKGPVEFRAIAAAFNDMQDKINRFVRDRTELVIALSHDLRTPLTRLQLRAEYVDDPEQRQRMLDELHFMEMLTDQLLSFASFNPRNEPMEKVDFAVLLVTLCDDRTDAGAVIEYSGPSHLALHCRPTAILRAIVNLIDNAIKYSDYAYVSLIPEINGVRIFVRDSGPGIPEDEMEKVFQPFYRVDASRSRETGGLGMGLSVARAIILEHRGAIHLRNRQPHGLEVEVFLPFGLA